MEHSISRHSAGLMRRSRVSILILGLLAASGGARTMALDVRAGDLITMTVRVDPGTGRTDPLAPIYPRALAVDGEDYLVLSTGSSSNGFVRKLWRHTPATGRNSLIAVTQVPINHVFGNNLLAVGRGGRAYVLAGRGTTTVEGLLEIELETGESRLITGPGVPSGSPTDLVVAPNGNLVSLRGNAIHLIRPDGGSVAGPVTSPAVQALTRTPEGRIFGIAPNLLVFQPSTDLVEIDPETGARTVLATFPSVGVRNTTMRLAAGLQGDFYLSYAVNTGARGLYRIHGDPLQLTEVPLPEHVELDLLSDLDVDSQGRVLVVGTDASLIPGGSPGVVRLDPRTGATETVLGQRLEPTSVSHFAPGPGREVFFTAGSRDRDRVYRQDLVTGVVSLVTSKDSPEAVLHAATQIAVHGDQIYVIDHFGDNQETHLVRVDAATGRQAYLTQLGPRLFPSHMVYDETSGDLWISAWGGHTSGCCGSVIRVRPDVGAQPEFVTTTGYLGNPEGIRVGPDGDIYIIGRTEGATGVYRIDRETGAQSVVTESVLLGRPYYLDFVDDTRLAVMDIGAPGTGRPSLWIVDVENGGDPLRLAAYEDGTAEAQNQFGGFGLARVAGAGSNPGNAPALATSHSDDGVLLTWPQDGQDWTLQGSSEIQGDSWTDLGLDPQQIGTDRWGVNLSADDPVMYFRLRSD